MNQSTAKIKPYFFAKCPAFLFIAVSTVLVLIVGSTNRFAIWTPKPLDDLGFGWCHPKSVDEKRAIRRITLKNCRRIRYCEDFVGDCLHNPPPMAGSIF